MEKLNIAEILKDCPFNEYRCSKLGYIDAEMDCIKYNLATMKIKELEEEK